MEVFQDLINRGLKKVLMFICDDFNPDFAIEFVAVVLLLEI